MKNIFLIFKNDVMKIHKNVIAMIVIMGITVIPTLYAWFNISASWDPYGNTGELKLAVASDDEGYTGERFQSENDECFLIKYRTPGSDLLSK